VAKTLAGFFIALSMSIATYDSALATFGHITLACYPTAPASLRDMPAEPTLTQWARVVQMQVLRFADYDLLSSL
jgi:hypothetical protein